MMLRSEQLQPKTAQHCPTSSAQHSTRQEASSRVPATQPGLDTLLESLIPEDLSPNKRAVIEQLVKRYR